MPRSFQISIRRRGLRSGGACAGASLIEVALALAILATVMVSVMALMARGMQTMGQALDTSTAIRIAKQLHDEVQAMDWEEAVNVDGRTRFFDHQGVELDSDGEWRVYAAKVILDPDGHTGIRLSGDTATSIQRSDDLRCVVVRISGISGQRGIDALSGTGRSRDFRDFPGLISRKQRLPSSAAP